MAAVTAAPLQANEVDEFELMRRRIREQQAQVVGQQQAQSQRRFAALGNFQSGAAAKQEQLIAQAGEQQTGQRLADVDIQQAAAARAKAEAEAGRAFQTSERLGGQTFTGSQADLQRQFLTGERTAGQEYGSREAGLQRGFLTGERLGGQEFTAGQAGVQRQFLTGERLGGQQFATGERLGGQQFASGEAGLQRQFATGERLGGQSFADDQRRHAQAFQTDENRATRAIQQQGVDLQRRQIDDARALSDREYQANQVAQFINGIAPLKAAGFTTEGALRALESVGFKFDGSGQILAYLNERTPAGSYSNPLPDNYVPSLGRSLTQAEQDRLNGVS